MPPAPLILRLNSLVAVLLLLGAPLVADALVRRACVRIVQVLTFDLLLTALAAMPQAMLERGLRFRDCRSHR